jgi:5'-nucleotidase
MTSPLILITNDDGLHSPGLAAVVRAVRDLGDLLIVAPAEQQSGMGRSMPGFFSCALTPRTLTVDGVDYTAYAIDGSPAQAVLHAILGLAKRRPALVVSGINHGENLGADITISGTVGAALQAGGMGVPGLAMSLEVPKEFHYNHDSGDRISWGASEHFTRLFAERLLAESLPKGVYAVKVDIPADATPETAWRVTRQAVQSYFGRVGNAEETQLDMPRALDYEVHVDWETLARDSDIWAFAHDREVAVVPLTLDLSGGIDLAGFAEAMKR